ncbi:MAG: MGH1-like glycoside hydrolase domain-containing protein [Terriglobia bacterium]
MNEELKRLDEERQRTAHWKRWGPYLSERQWATVREDYSADGDAWDYFPHDHARLRAYRWGEDGLGGISDRHQLICFAPAFWNGRDSILKERMFGLTSHEGNHGEDVKEYYFYLDSTPTHSYMKYLYKYPQAEFPYARLVEENEKRTKRDPEFELIDTGIFDADRYFDIFVEYAKAGVEDILIRFTAFNRGPEAASLRLLPTLWFRNTWSWGRHPDRPRVSLARKFDGMSVLEAEQDYYGKRWLAYEGTPPLLFTENETNYKVLDGVENKTPYVKDAFHEYVVHNQAGAVNPALTGTKAAVDYALQIDPGKSVCVRARLCGEMPGRNVFSGDFDAIFKTRIAEADEFYEEHLSKELTDDCRAVQRQAFAGLMWGKQFYHYDVATWLEGDPTMPAPPATRLSGRNHTWKQLYNADVISMPDKWEYPWYAAWDLAFHTIALAVIDPDFAKDQLILFLREWYMRPNGQLPAYEWKLGDVNPPVHAWAVWRVYKIDQRIRGKADRAFLERAFHKLLLNFTWWVNRKDPEGMNVFEGGFLGLDNIGVFDRSASLPMGGHIEQSDGTSWMGMFCLNMLDIAMELASFDPVYEDVASKFFEHFVLIAHAMNDLGGGGIDLWDETDGFYYDVLHLPDGARYTLRVRSMVGLIPLFGVMSIEPEVVDKLPDFKQRMQWFLDHSRIVSEHVDQTVKTSAGPRRLLTLVARKRLERVLRYMLDEAEFLSPHGLRALSKFHQEHPYILHWDGYEHRVSYDPGESTTGMFGGNSNWRGPVWFPLNFLMIESLQKFHYYFGDSLKVEYPTGSGQLMNLWCVAREISRRLTRLFLRADDGLRPVYGDVSTFQHDPHWRDLIQFYEYFHGDNGRGLGASHQTGWTSLVGKLIEQSGEE